MMGTKKSVSGVSAPVVLVLWVMVQWGGHFLLSYQGLFSEGSMDVGGGDHKSRGNRMIYETRREDQIQAPTLRFRISRAKSYKPVSAAGHHGAAIQLSHKPPQSVSERML
eukprot:1137801-Pelagomonas_calceolata.AAC.2